MGIGVNLGLSSKNGTQTGVFGKGVLTMTFRTKKKLGMR